MADQGLGDPQHVRVPGAYSHQCLFALKTVENGSKYCDIRCTIEVAELQNKPIKCVLHQMLWFWGALSLYYSFPWKEAQGLKSFQKYSN